MDALLRSCPADPAWAATTVAATPQPGPLQAGRRCGPLRMFCGAGLTGAREPASERVTSPSEHPVNGPLERLIDAWCERRDLRSLALLLPAHTSNAGLTDDWARVVEALYDLRARGRLPDAEQAEIDRHVPIVEAMVYRR